MANPSLLLGLLLAGGAGIAALPLGGGEQPKTKQEENAKPPAHEAKRPRADRFGDPLPEGAIARLGTMRLRHGNGTGVVFAPDGKSLLTCGADLTVRTWDLATGRLLREQQLPRVDTLTPAVALSPDGRYAVFGKIADTLILWDLRADKLQHEFPIQGGWPRVLFSPDSKMLVTANAAGALHVRDVDTGKSRLLGQHGRKINSLSFTADKTLLSLADDKTLRFWNVKEGRERSRLTLKEPVPTAAVSPDGRAVAVTTYSNKQKSVRFWDATNGKPFKDWKDWGGPKNPSPAVQFTPDGKTVLISTKDGVTVWDPRAGKCIQTLPGRRASHFAFSPDGKTVASLGGPLENGFQMESMVQVWDLATGKPHAANRPENGLLNPTDGLAFSPDGRTLVSASGNVSASENDQNIHLWDVATSRPLRSLPVKELGAFDPLSFTPDGKELLLGTSPAIVRLEVATRREVRRYSPGKKGKEDQYVMRMHLCDDDRTLLALSHHQDNKAGGGPMGLGLAYSLHAWNLTTGELSRSVPLTSQDIWIGYSRFSPNGRLFAIPDGSICEVSTGEEVARLSVGDKSLGTPVAFSPDGALIAAGVKGEIKRGKITIHETVAIQVWEAATLAPVARLTTGQVAHIAFTPDGRRLVSAGLDALTLWDIASGRVLVRRPAPGRFRGIYGPSFANCLAIAADGRTVATGNADTTILLWNLSPPPRQSPVAALTDAQREACWADLAEEDAGRALAAIGHMVDEPEQSVSLLRARLRAAKAPPAEELARLLTDLDNAQFERRELASKKLAEMGELAQTALRQALERKPVLEVRRRIENLLAASRRVHVPEERRRLRAVRVLESIGTAEARQVLETLAKGAADARLTTAAKVALTRLARRAKP
ncbi:MAG TPA: WD40 repeat domain-containing protein [Gemmataceae bacterium]|jgi:WD40 repeat protein